jgi:hypothetical protein
MNLPDSKNRYASLGKHIQQHGLWRIDGVIVPSRGPREMAGGAGKWTRNDAPNTVRPVEQFPRNLAHAIKLRDLNDLFMRGNLKNAVA